MVVGSGGIPRPLQAYYFSACISRGPIGRDPDARQVGARAIRRRGGAPAKGGREEEHDRVATAMTLEVSNLRRFSPGVPPGRTVARAERLQGDRRQTSTRAAVGSGLLRR